MDPIYLTSYPSSPDPAQVNQSLRALYAALGAGKQDRLCFASGGRDALEKILYNHYFETVRETGKNHLLILPGQERWIGSTLKRLEQIGCSFKTLPLNAQGQLTAQTVAAHLTPRVGFLTLPWADPVTGVIHPIEEIAAVCQQHQVRVHLDITSALGKLFFRFQHLAVDYLSFDGEPLKAPRGTGAILVKEALPFPEQDPPSEQNLQGLLHAVDQWMLHFDHLSTETARLRALLEKKVIEVFPEATPLFHQVDRLPSIAVIAFPGVAASYLSYLLERKEIYTDPHLLAPQLLASGIEAALAHSALSFNLSYTTTQQEIERVVEEITHLLKKVRPLSKELL